MKRFLEILLSVLIILNLSACQERDFNNPTFQSEITCQEVEEAYTFAVPNNLYSPAVYVMDADTKECVYTYQGSEYIYPASMTKIMTAIVAIENLPDLETPIKIKQSQIDPLYLAGASLTGFRGGEILPAIDLLYGVLLPSGAESCSALAEYICGSNEKFVELMNEKAEELALTHTHFVTDSGLHDNNHYSSCEDIAKLFCYALQNKTFYQIITTPSYTCSNGLRIDSTLLPKLPKNEKRILGGKTGYTEEAGLCLASFCKMKEHSFIIVTAAANGNHKTPQYNIIDTITILDSINCALVNTK